MSQVISPTAPGHAPAQSKADRVLSRDPEAFPVPTGREEEWRFTPVARIRGLLDGSLEADPTGAGGHTVSVEAPEGVVVERVDLDDPRVGSVLCPPDRATAIAMSRAGRPLVLTVPPDTAVDAPVTIVVKGEGGTTYGHLVIELKPFSTATVVLDHVGTGTFSGSVEVVVGDGADLTFVSLQDWDRGATHLGHHAARVGRDASYRSFVVSLGGELVRLAPTVEFASTGGNAELYGLFFADAGQHLEHRVFVDHEQPHCRSRVTYKGALQGAGARTVWIGDVFIGAQAVGTDTYELNRNLVLTDGAHADSVPNLEIETGEVSGAGHASATGRFDDEQLFYLQARGIPADEARRMVVRGFFAEVLERIELPELRERLLSAIDDELARVSA